MKRLFLMISAALVAVTVAAKHYPDSIMEQSRAEKNIAYGWNFEFAAGGGVSHYLFDQLGSSFVPAHTTNKIHFPSVNASVGINYYFVPWMGIGTGAQFSTYQNRTAITGPWTIDGSDAAGDNYTLTAQPYNLYERQSIYMLEVPVALKFRVRPGVAGFTATAGAKLGIPMSCQYQLMQGGEIRNSVHYPFYNLTMSDVPGVIENVYPVKTTVKMPAGTLRQFNFAAYAEIGMLIRVHQRVELAITAYANYYFLDMLSAPNTTALGFDDGGSIGKYPLPYTTAYAGVLRTTEVASLHPWSAGLKIGIQVNANRTKAQRDFDKEQNKLRKQKPEPKEEPKDTIPEEPIDTIVEEPIDTTFVEEIDPIEEALDRIIAIADSFGIDLCEELCEEVHDTVYIERPQAKRDPVAVMLDEELQKSVIYFELNKAEPIMRPNHILQRVAEILSEHPDSKIRVNGHACKLGTREYNKRLALYRANVIAERLRRLGVREDQMIVGTRGEDIPYHYNGKHQLNKDRRVEIIPEFQLSETVDANTDLKEMAEYYYGDAELWIFIYAANRDLIDDPNHLPIGEDLRIPNLMDQFEDMTDEQIDEAIDKVRKRLGLR